MANYLMKYKGKYRLKAPYDMSTNQFSRKMDMTTSNNSFEDIDVYIDCNKGIMITHSKQSILQVWIPSAVRGRNIVQKVKEELGENILFDLVDNETEYLFKFHSKHMESLEPYLCPKTGGADISPFSSRNLPKSTYVLPEKDLKQYQEVIKDVPKEKSLAIAHLTTSYIKNLDKSKGGYEKHKEQMALNCVKGKEYVHKIGKWEDYLTFLSTNLEGEL